MERAQGGYGLGFSETDIARLRTVTSSTAGTTLSGSTLGEAPSTAFTTPDLGSLASPNPNQGEPSTPSAPSTLQPVTAMITSDAELQLGLAKVAEPDVDAFMSYAALVPEYCRLEGLLIKAIV